MNAKLRVAGMIALGALVGALATTQLQAIARNAAAPLPLEELQQLAAVFGMVKSDYVEQVDEKKLIGDAISGMVAGLDPHSQYFDKKSFKEFREGTTGRFVGVGIEITQEDGLVKVVSPIEGSPAFRAGLAPGDLITKIDDTAVKGLTLNDAVKRMRGEPNTKVVLTILRKSENRNFPVTITREEIKTVSVKGRVVEPGYGWIRLTQFQERTVEDFARKLDEIGFETFWLAEHHFQHEGYECIPNVLMMALHLAHRTTRLRIGCGFNIAPMWHPLRLAEDFAADPKVGPWRPLAASNCPFGRPASLTRKSPESARHRIWMSRRRRFCRTMRSGRLESSLKK